MVTGPIFIGGASHDSNFRLQGLISTKRTALSEVELAKKRKEIEENVSKTVFVNKHTEILVKQETRKRNKLVEKLEMSVK